MCVNQKNCHSKWGEKTKSKPMLHELHTRCLSTAAIYSYISLLVCVSNVPISSSLHYVSAAFAIAATTACAHHHLFISVFFPPKTHWNTQIHIHLISFRIQSMQYFDFLFPQSKFSVMNSFHIPAREEKKCISFLIAYFFHLHTAVWLLCNILCLACVCVRHTRHKTQKNFFLILCCQSE